MKTGNVLALGILAFVLMVSCVSAESYNYNDGKVSCNVVEGADDVVCNYVEPAVSNGKFSANSFSASCYHDCEGPKDTVVKGWIYDEETGVGIEGADVVVTCDREGTLTVKNFVSQGWGFFVVEFSDSECGIGDFVTVEATKGDLHGLIGPREVLEKMERCLDILMKVCVPMVPEFGGIALILSGMAGVGIFFLVRRE